MVGAGGGEEVPGRGELPAGGQLQSAGGGSSHSVPPLSRCEVINFSSSRQTLKLDKRSWRKFFSDIFCLVIYLDQVLIPVIDEGVSSVE